MSSLSRKKSISILPITSLKWIEFLPQAFIIPLSLQLDGVTLLYFKLRSTTSSCKDIGIIKSKFGTEAQAKTVHVAFFSEKYKNIFFVCFNINVLR